MLTIDDAFRIFAEVFQAAGPLVETESLALDQAVGRFLAADIEARYDTPFFDQSAMDGIAFAHQDSLTADRLTVRGAIAAGDAPEKTPLAPGCCVRIMTGAPLPAGADTVAPIEQVRIQGDQAHLQQKPAQGAHVRRRGENISAGQLLYAAGAQINAAKLAGLMSQGIRRVTVRRKLRIGVVTTGNEIIDFRLPLSPGQIYNTNGPALCAALAGPDREIQNLGVCTDQLEATTALLKANSDLDLVVMTGGVSMGAYDYVPAAAQQAGFVKLFHKLKIKPGKPLLFARHSSGAMLFGLPGNPVSALVGAALFVNPMALALTSGAYQRPSHIALPLSEPARHRGPFPYYVPLRVIASPTGTKVAVIQTSGSGDVVGFANYQALGVLPARSELKAGELIEVLLCQVNGMA